MKNLKIRLFLLNFSSLQVQKKKKIKNTSDARKYVETLRLLDVPNVDVISIFLRTFV